MTTDDATMLPSDSTINRRVQLAATNDFTPWFIGDILACLASISVSEVISKFTDADEDDWFMYMSELGDTFSEDET